MQRRWLSWLLAATALGALGCPSEDTPADAGMQDTGVAADTTPPADTGAPPMDTGAPPQDTGAPPADTGVPPADTGVPPADTGVPPVDTGTPPADTGTPPVDAPMPTARTLPTAGSAVALTADDQFAVAVNRTADTVRVFRTMLGATPPTATPVGADLTFANGEPWAAVIGNDDNTAYVILRRDQRVVRITNLRTAPAVSGMANTGSEPTGLAISPTGARLYVANWAQGTVTEVNTADMTVARTIDLNPALAGSNVLGTVTARPGLAHPRAIVVTNNGNPSDADETVYVTEFFSQARTTGVPTDDSAFDLGRQGMVYRFNAGSGMVGAPITIAPVADTGFAPAAGAPNTGCFPNQLFAAAISSNRLYVTSVCESPRGPVNFRANLYTAVFVVDTATNAEVPGQGLVLTQRFNTLYNGVTPALAEGDPARRLPLIPNDIAFVPRGTIAYVTSYGSDALFRVRYNPDGSFGEVGSAANRFINLAAGATPGRLPIGVAVANMTPQRAVVLNENSRTLSVVDLNDQAVAASAASAPAPGSATETAANNGQRFFVTGLGRWSFGGQGWGSCEGCHPDGLTDNVTWFFARGPRQTTSMDATHDTRGNQRILNWTGIFDEVHDFELNTRDVSGGVGAIVHTSSTPPANTDRIDFTVNAGTGANQTRTPQQGMNGSTRSLMPDPIGSNPVRSTLRDWEEIDEYAKTIRAPRGLVGLVGADVTAGRALFESRNCGGCHGSRAGANLWTIAQRFFAPGEANNNPATGLLRMRTYMGFSGARAGLNPPSAAAAAPLRFTNADPMVVAGNDQINCVLRAVGTFPATLDGMQTGIAPTGVRVREVRANMMTAAQGATGFSPASVLGMVTGAPYFHAGNARTLEEVLSDTFRSHHQALATNFLDPGDPDRATQIRQLVAFLLSIDDATMPVPVPTLTGGVNPDLCPTTVP